MQVKPHHFHLAVASLLGIASLFLAVNGQWVGAGLMGGGAIAAALHWRAAKAGITDE